jgi:hypothetical protein
MRLARIVTSDRIEQPERTDRPACPDSGNHFRQVRQPPKTIALTEVR